MEIRTLHEWALTPNQAVDLQRRLAAQVVDRLPLPLEAVGSVAGVDVSVKDNLSQAAVVVLNFPALKVIETVTAQLETPFPYISGLLSFREAPVLLKAFALLRHTPDVFLFDGMGKIHPRRFGIACHMGLWLNKPSIGCGKTPYIGTYVEPPHGRGSYAALHDKGEVIGVVLRTRSNVKPLYVSVGHLIDLESARQIVMACTTRYRLPEPIRQAHQAAGNF
ncbi:MAG: endonuclease V [Chloroflexi bacterium CFX4]|nr:endonuclease V [Chloroflexi bacterium CFX4]MDL1921658.1 endonuclease V [Chloroflexi bacterium CFX3]